jgi:hypothetical protein
MKTWSNYLQHHIVTCMGYFTNNCGFRIRWIDLFNASPVVTALSYHNFKIAVTITQTIITLSRCNKVFDCWNTFNDVFTDWRIPDESFYEYPYLTNSQSQSYFTTGNLPPITSSWRQAPWDPRPEFIFQLNSCVNRYYVTSSLTRR